jgi:long-chain acyl-CoA synthetase
MLPRPLLAEEKVMASAQIAAFILHKQLDADDGVDSARRKFAGFVAERYAPLITALYDGSHEADISTEVAFEDGRKGVVEGDVAIRDIDGASEPPARKAA